MDKRFENVTMTGRLCYIFMCIERYLLALYPDRDWSLVARKMWRWPKETNWVDGGAWDAYLSVLPELVMTGYKSERAATVEEYVSAPWHEITREEYEQAAALYTGITDGNAEDEFCKVIALPHLLVKICDGGCFDDDFCD